jgi:glycosyltransferase involved in cell wall biosynthesis
VGKTDVDVANQQAAVVAKAESGPDLTVILPTRNEAATIGRIVSAVNEQINLLSLNAEIFVVDGSSRDHTREIAKQAGAIVWQQQQLGFAAALREAFSRATGEYILTMDSDGSHSADFISSLWNNRLKNGVVIGSRHIAGGSSRAPLLRRILSRALSCAYRAYLKVPIRDISSGFRLYHRDVLTDMRITARQFDVQAEIIAQSIRRHHPVIELPLSYLPRHAGRSNAALLNCGVAFLRTMFRMRRLLNQPQ